MSEWVSQVSTQYSCSLVQNFKSKYYLNRNVQKSVYDIHRSTKQEWRYRHSMVLNMMCWCHLIMYCIRSVIKIYKMFHQPDFSAATWALITSSADILRDHWLGEYCFSSSCHRAPQSAIETSDVVLLLQAFLQTPPTAPRLASGTGVP